RGAPARRTRGECGTRSVKPAIHCGGHRYQPAVLAQPRRRLRLFLPALRPAYAAWMRLLLVEDNERFAALLRQGLAAAGFTVDVLASAEDAAAALEASRFDLVALDLGLPDRDGLDVLGEMRRGGDATPVMILTARGSLKDRVTGLQSGADD